MNLMYDNSSQPFKRLRHSCINKVRDNFIHRYTLLSVTNNDDTPPPHGKKHMIVRKLITVRTSGNHTKARFSFWITCFEQDENLRLGQFLWR